jgi:hypothetical protein
MAYKVQIITVLLFVFSLCAVSVSAIELTDGLVGYWPLDGNGNDESDNGHDARLKKGAKWTNNGWVNGAVEVDGEDGHVVVDDRFELTTDTITVIARINGWKTIDWSGIVVGRSETPFWMGIAANNTLTYVWNNNSPQTWAWRGGPEVPQGEWTLVAIAIEPNKATAYTYHEATGQLNAKVNDIPHIEQKVVNLKFGWDECCGARYFKGLIDEVMIYDRTLNADEIKNLAVVGLPTISISPALVSSPSVGQQLTLSLNVAGGQKVAGYQASVEFDPTALRYVSSKNGEYLRSIAIVAPAVVTENTVTLAAASLVGETQGHGTLATLSFEVVAFKSSSVRLLNVWLTDRSGGSLRPRIEHGQITGPPILAGDINGDGIVSIQDLVQVVVNFGEQGEHDADINGDGVVNIVDLTLVAATFWQNADAPSVWHGELEAPLTRANLQQWLREARQINLTYTTFQRGILVLEKLLAVSTPKETMLLPNYPNPFNPETWIPYQLAEPSAVTLRIYDVRGAVVRHLHLGHQPAGIYESRSRAVYWDGKNNLGEPVASGLYFYTLTAGEFTATRKLLIRK